MSEPHLCLYRERLVWSEWSRTGALAERLGRRVPTCEVCGRERPARRPRSATLREVRAESPEASPLADPTGRAVAAALLRVEKGGVATARGVLGELARHDLPASVAEEWIDRFLRAGLLTATWKLGASPSLATVNLLQGDALREFAWPGQEARRRGALDEARERTAVVTHPKAAEISALLGSAEAEDLPPDVLQALAALALHAEAGDVLAERVFSARHLGSSKTLLSLRGRLERLVGPLSEIGIREGASLTLLGGEGLLRLTHRHLDLRDVSPFVGLSRETVESLESIGFPRGGLFVVENLAVFEACCRGEVDAARGMLIAWSAGYPSPSLRKLVALASEAEARLSIWADLDLDGVRIARLIASWSAAGASFFRMAPENLAAAPRKHSLSPRSVAAIRRDLEERPGAALAETLRALLEAGSWVEQEAFLAGG